MPAVKTEQETFRLTDSVEEEGHRREIRHKAASSSCVKPLENLISSSLTSLHQMRPAVQSRWAFLSPSTPTRTLLFGASSFSFHTAHLLRCERKIQLLLGCYFVEIWHRRCEILLCFSISVALCLSVCSPHILTELGLTKGSRYVVLARYI